MNNRSIVLRKSGGFYQVFDDDALIISYLFDYKINNYRCGFPINSLNKVINILEDKCINYIIKDENNESKDFKKKNNYLKFLEKSKVKDNINNRVNNILNKLKDLDKNKLNDILSIIEEYLYE